ncbi:MAG: RNA-binding protein [Bacteroidales bacterium]|jgi:RNA recognition motif-containing protein|nr:RNA-binding protein [Bacteroidales bacterium]
MNIFIGSLPFRTKESELRSFFENYGEVSRASIITDRETGRSRGFGFVEMPDDDSATKAIEGLNGTEIEGRAIVVKEAMERTERRNDFRR